MWRVPGEFPRGGPSPKSPRAAFPNIRPVEARDFSRSIAERMIRCQASVGKGTSSLSASERRRNWGGVGGNKI